MSAAAKPALDPYAILQKVADGLTIGDIARDFGYSYNYVKLSLLRHYDRVGATYLAHAVSLAYRAGKIS